MSKILFIDEYITGKLPRDIFIENGFDIDIVGIKRVEQSDYRWKKTYDKGGIIALDDTRKFSSSRPLNRELTNEEIIERQEARIKLLEAQVELLKKLEEKERLLIKKNKELNTSNKFELIKMILENEYNIIYSLKKIQQIMKKYEIICPHRNANPYNKIAKATKEHRVVANILERNFKQETPGVVLLTDITYYHTAKTVRLIYRPF